jgi:hypothetical protein
MEAQNNLLENEHLMNESSMLQYSQYVDTRVGKLLIKKLIYDNFAVGRSRYKYLCDCDCGTKDKLIPCWYITSKNQKSCGCLNRVCKIDHNANIGKRFGMLTILAVKKLKQNNDKYKKIYYECKCDCGSIRLYQAHTVLSNGLKSCGCKQSSQTIDNYNSHIGKRYGTLTVINLNYSPNNSTFTCKCDCGNVIDVPVSRINTKRTCGKCFSNTHSYDNYLDLINYCETAKLQLLSNYTTKSSFHDNSTTYNQYEFLCLICNRKFFKSLSPSSLLICPYCNDRFSSNTECMISKFLSDLNVSFTKHLIASIDDNQNNIEIDFFISSHNLGIELHGLLTHATYDSNNTPWYVVSRYSNYHLNKLESATTQNIDLLQFWNTEVYQKTDIVKSIILNRLNLTPYSTYARNCYVNVIDKHTSDSFLNTHHIQGTVTNDSVRLGLFHKSTNNLVSVMTFGSSRFSNHDWELYRFATYINCRIVGAASKLFKYFIRNYDPKSIVSYSDRRLFDTGKLYDILGFKFDHVSAPNYWYFKRHHYERNAKLYHRVQFQKHKLSDVFDNFDSSKTEYQNMEMNGYLRIYDCGNKVYVWTS